MNVDVGPKAQAKIKRLFYEVATYDPTTFFQAGQTIDRFPDTLIYTDKKDGNELTDLKILKLDGRKVLQFLYAKHATLRHVIDMRVLGLARLSWPAIYSPLHDALIEDALDRAESALGVGAGRRSPWSPRVRALRRVLGGPGLRRRR